MDDRVACSLGVAIAANLMLTMINGQGAALQPGAGRTRSQTPAWPGRGRTVTAIPRRGAGKPLLLTAGSGQVDPTVSYAYALVRRPDVQNELHLDLRQRESLSQLQEGARERMRQQMQHVLAQRHQALAQQRLRTSGTQAENWWHTRSATQKERTALQGYMSDRLNSLLRPEQSTRLQQLDLQVRGVLSLADTSVSAQVKVSADHQAAIAALIGGYRDKTREAINQWRKTFRTAGLTGASGAGNAEPSTGFDSIQRAESRARKEAEDRAVALLSADEKSRWDRALGKPFTFRKEPTTQ